MPRAKRRQFSARYKLRILEEADACTKRGQIGALLRREGLYSSHLSKWRQQRALGQLERALDLFLSGGFPKEMLADRKARLERTIVALERECAGLLAGLRERTVSDEQVQGLKDFMGRVNPGIDVADEDFQIRRGVIEALNVQDTLSVEGGQKTVKSSCVVGDRVYELHPGAQIYQLGYLGGSVV